MILNPFNDQFNTFANTYDNAIKKLQKQQIDEHESYFKNKCERLVQKANALKASLLMLESDDFPDCPDGSCRPIPAGDSDAIANTKWWKEANPPEGPYIDSSNWQNLYNQWWNQRNNPPSWFRPEYWMPGATLQDAWYNFCTAVAGAILRAGQNNNPEYYWNVVGRWNERTSAANNGSPMRFPVVTSNGVSYGGRYARQAGNRQVAGSMTQGGFEPHF